MAKRLKPDALRRKTGESSAALRQPVRDLPFRRANLRQRCLASTALSGLVLVGGLTGLGYANPTGGNVVAGDATISQPNSTLTEINQASQRAIIDWKSFSIGAGEQTQFHQPNSNAFTLNRVTGPDPSVIAGKLGANGNIAIVNQSGIFFSKGSQIDVNGLIATTADIHNKDFMAGRLNFNIPSANPNAMVVNEGQITLGDRGLGALVAPGVANAGIIKAKLGKVVLAGAETFTVDFYGDGLINFDVSSQVKQAPLGPDGKPIAALVTNTGKIEAAGGTILLTADAVDNIVTDLVHAGGALEAKTAGTHTGQIIVDGGSSAGGTVLVTGRLDATGRHDGQTGGSVSVRGDHVGVMAGATIDVSGAAGGGTVAIGGTLHGAVTLVQKGAKVKADALVNGNGGQIAVWSEKATGAYGSFSARGGTAGGNGGLIETSSHGYLDVAGIRVDASAVYGIAGQWLLDPANVTIVSGGGNPAAGSGGSPDIFSPNATTPNDTTIDPGVIEAQLNGGTSVVINTSPGGTQAGDITVSSDVAWSTNQTLTLQGDHDVLLGANITGASGTLTLQAGNAISQTSGVITVNTLNTSSATGTTLTDANKIANLGTVSNSTSGDVNITNARDLTQTGAWNSAGNITITTSGAGANLALSQNIGAVTLALNVAGTIMQSGGIITATTLTGGSNGSASFGGANDVANLGPFTTGNGDFTLIEARTGLTVTGLNAGTGTVTLGSASGRAMVVGAPDANPLVPADALFISDASLGNVTAGSLVLSAADALFANGVTDHAGYGHLLTLNSGRNIVFDGAVSVGTGTLTLTAAGTITQNAGIITATTLTGSASGTVGLGGANQITNLGAFTTGGGDFTLIDNATSLTLTAAVNAGSGTVTLGAASGRSLVVGAADGAAPGTALLISDASLDNVTAGSLVLQTGGASDDIFANGVTTHAGFGALALNAARDVVLDDNLSVRTGGTLTLTAGRKITQNAGIIAADTLTGSAHGDVKLGGANVIAALGAFSTFGLGNITLADNVAALTLTDNISAAGKTVSLTNSGGTITQSGGIITADTLKGGSAGNASFGDANQVANLGPFTTGGGDFTLIDDMTGLTVTGLNAGAGTVTLGAAAGRSLLVGGPDASAPPTALVISDSSLGQITGASLVLQTSGATDDIFASGVKAHAGYNNRLTLSSGRNIAFDGDVSVSSAGTLTLTAAGKIDQNAGAITAGTLTGSSKGNASFTGANAIANLGPFSTDGAAFDTNGGTFTLTNQGGFNLVGDLAGSSVTLTSNTGGITQTGGIIIAGTLTGSTKGNASFADANTIANLGPFSTDGAAFDAGGGTFTLTNQGGFNIVGNLAGSTVTLTSNAGGITQTGGIITAGTLTGSTVGDANFTAANAIANLGPFSTDGAAFDAGGGAFTLTNQGGFNIAGNLAGSIVTLTSNTGGITQTGGIITAGTLTGSTKGNASFTAANAIANLGPFSTDGTAFDAAGGAFTLINQGGFTITGNLAGSTVTLTSNTGGITQTGGIITAGTLTGSTKGNASFTAAANAIANLGPFSTDGAAFDAGGGAFTLTNQSGFTITGNLAGSTVTLTSNTGGITQTGGIITAATLTGSSVGDASFSKNNAIANLGPFSTDGGAFDAAGGAFTLTNQSGFIIVGNLAGSTVTLTSNTGGITQTGGIITAATLTGSTKGNASFADANAIANLGPFSTDGGAFDTAGGAFTLTNQGGFAITGNLAGSIVTLTSNAGGITQTGGIITAGTLTGSTVGDASFGKNNAIANLGPFSTDGAAFDTAGGAFTLINQGGFNIAGNLAGSTVTLTSNTGGITQTGGIITAGTLSGSTKGNGSFTAANAIANLGPFSTDGGAFDTAGGAFTLTNQSGFTITGNLAGSIVTLTSNTGGITQTGGIITAGTLTGSTVGDASFGGANLIANLGTFNTTGGAFDLNDNQALALADDLTAAGNTVTLTAAGTITQNAGVITAAILTGSSVGDASFGGGNLLASLGKFTTNGGAFTLNNKQSLNLIDDVTATGNTVALTAAGTITQTFGKVISAAILTGSSQGDVSFGGDNLLANVGKFTTNGGNFTLNNKQSLGLTDDLTASGAVVNLTIAGSITQTLGKTITANILTGSSSGDASFKGTNLVADLGFNTNGGAFTFNDNQSFTVDTLNVPGNTVTLTSAGGITQNIGVITATTLTGSSNGAAIFEGSNNIANLGSFTTNGGAFTLNNERSLALIGDLTAIGNTVSLAASGSIVQASGIITAAALTGRANGDANFSSDNLLTNLAWFTAEGGAFTLNNSQSLAITDAVTARGHTVTLTVAGTIVETGGFITAASFTGSSVGTASFGGNNAIGALAGFTTNGGAFSLHDTQNLALAGNLTATGNTVNLAAGTINQISGIITAQTLNGSSSGGASFGGANQVAALGSFSNTGFGDLTFVDAMGFSTVGTVSSARNLSLTASGAGANLTLGGNLVAGASVVLNAGGAIAQTGGIIAAGTLAGSAASGVQLNAANQVSNFGTFTNGSGDLSFVNAQSVTVGSVQSGRDIALTTLGGADMTLAGTISAGRNLMLNAGGAISQTGGLMIAAQLSGSAVGGANFASLNQIGVFGSFINAGSGDINFVDAIAFTTAGTLSAARNIILSGPGIVIAGNAVAGQTITVASTGTLTTTGDVELTAGDMVKLGGLTFIDDSFTVNSPVLEIVTGPGITASTLGCDQCRTASDIGQLAAASTFNDSYDGTVFLSNLQAPNTQVLIDSGLGSVTGSLNVGGLGIAGQGSTAVLNGTIAGVGGQAAANLGIHTPHPDNGYRINDCAIGAVNCNVIPLVPPVIVQPTNFIDLFQARLPSDPLDIDRLNTGSEDSL